MSFSSKVKAELCREAVSRKCCAAAEAYGALLYGNSFSAGEIRIITGSPDFAKRLPALFRRAFSLTFDERGEPDATGKRALVISDALKISKVFESFGYSAESAVAHHINRGLVDEDCCRVSFMRGVFLSGGSVTDPAKRYHLELVTDHYSVSREAYSLLLDMGFSPKETSRSGNYIIYFKQSEAIEDFLTTIGAPVSAMDLMSAKIEKDMRNTVNRKVNCDTANADKVVNAAQAQLDAIRRIDRGLGLDSLPEKLHETALLRIANPEASIADLAALADPPVTKSCMGHRLRKLTDMELKEV